MTIAAVRRLTALLAFVGLGVVEAEQLTLDGALQRALDRSPTILTARNSLEISRRNLLAQRAALKSQFFLTLTPLLL